MVGRRSWHVRCGVALLAGGLPLACASLSGLSGGTDASVKHDAQVADAAPPARDATTPLDVTSPVADATTPVDTGSDARDATSTVDAKDAKAAKDAKDAGDASPHADGALADAHDAGPIVATSVSVGGKHACALLEGGTVWCWGANSYDQLGTGHSSDGGVPTPSLVPGLTGVTQVSVGFYHACALVTGGSVMCWGANTDGELGNGQTATSSPGPVAVVGITDAIAVAAGDNFTCALMHDHTVQCWGLNEDGELGNGGTTTFTAPKVVVGVTAAFGIAVGNFHACVLVSGGVQCFGSNYYGQLGRAVAGDAGNVNPGVMAVPGLTSGVSAIAAGGFHTCALLTTGAVKCWGLNSDGQLGDNSTVSSPTPVVVSGITGAVALAAGQYHTCAVVTGGSVQCWGNNASGELGNGGLENTSLVPVAVSNLTLDVPLKAGETLLSLGADSTCGVVTGGSIDCWGDDAYGEVGNGQTSGQVHVPVPVVW
jgi:alpha-tubulin suppressor-like RCC1 family protein